MCGIWCIATAANSILPINEEEANRLVNNTLAARGPEGGRVASFNNNVIMGFTRLAINGLSSAGMQPFTHNGITIICNGEIYNYKEIAKKYGFTLTTGSDCEVLPLLYEHLIDHPHLFWQELDGVFAAAIYDANRKTLMVGRDPYGVRPLFIGTTVSTNRFQDYEYIGFASEIKGLHPIGFDSIYQVTPGYYAIYDLSTLTLMDRAQYHTYPDGERPSAPIADIDLAKRYVRSTLMQAVYKRMLTERPVAALLSGGIDSSLIAALVQCELVAAGAPPLKTFSIGFEGSEDLRYAQMVADHIGSEHHEIVMTPDDFFAAIPEVIKDIESFDTTTVRASVGNWLVAREIRRRTDCKVVFNGDGSDEAFGSYMYFYKAPSDEEYEAETVRLLKDICYFDVLRSDRSISSHGLEPRTPFLDKNFVSTVHRTAVNLRRPIAGHQPEKWLLRSAFDGMNLLPSQVLWRKKEAFSDGVSGPKKLWFEEIQERLKTLPITPSTGGHMDPKTPEDIYYRSIFESLYPGRSSAIPYKWMPRWIDGATDPSARTLKVYDEAK
jgi:asparagine synthase (glutamine-hydrolysing)